MGLASESGPSGRTSFGLRILRYGIRALQLVLALAIAGVYGSDVNNARKQHRAVDSRWVASLRPTFSPSLHANSIQVYAEVVAGLSALTSILYLIPFLSAYLNASLFFAWDALLFIFWVAVFGAFGKLFLHRHPDLPRMRHAVWLDLVNMLLWFATAAVGGMMFLRSGWPGLSKLSRPRAAA
ncbi:MAG: hypothetical protein M1826_001037 [Phylliscum demangeonii]|nr:MAG: hypothetical protein M1826_001037 [Phylliscum demangeonii]